MLNRQKLKPWLMVPLFFLVAGCGSPLTNFSNLNSSNSTEALNNGFTALSNQDLASAKSIYCDALITNPQNSQLAFGCFLTKYLLLLEDPEWTLVLGKFNEGPVDMEVVLFGNAGVFNPNSNVGTHNFDYTDFPGLPFASIFAQTFGMETPIANILNQLIATGTTVQELQQDIGNQLLPDMLELENLIQITLNDSNFSFTIPKELFNSKVNGVITLNDAKIFAAITQFSIIGGNFLRAYDYGVTFSNFVNPNDTIDEAKLVDDFNGASSNVTVFLTLINGSLVTNEKARFIESITRLRDALQVIDSGVISQFGEFVLDHYNVPEKLTITNELLQSVQSPGMIPTSLLGSSNQLSFDLFTLFANPPSATNLQPADGDPFVLSGGQIKAVEGYFKKFFAGIAQVN